MQKKTAKKKATRTAKRQAARKQSDAQKSAAAEKKRQQAKLQRRVTLQELQGVQLLLQNQLQALQTQASSSFAQSWENDEQLKNGLDSSEFNLRAHQKVLNAMSLEFMAMRRILVGIAQSLDVEIGVENPEALEYVKMTQVDIQRDGEVKAIDRIDWSYYHEQVEQDLQAIAEIEAKRKAEEAAAAAAAAKAAEEEQAQKNAEAGAELSEELEQGIEELKEAAVAAGNDPEAVEAGARQLLGQSKRVAEELGKMKRGEPYDEAVIAEAQALIDADEAKEKGAPAAVPPQEEDEFPEGATIFGGS